MQTNSILSAPILIPLPGCLTDQQVGPMISSRFPGVLDTPSTRVTVYAECIYEFLSKFCPRH